MNREVEDFKVKVKMMGGAQTITAFLQMMDIIPTRHSFYCFLYPNPPYAHTHTHTRIHTHTHMHTHTCIHTHAYTHMHTYTHTRAHTPSTSCCGHNSHCCVRQYPYIPSRRLAELTITLASHKNGYIGKGSSLMCTKSIQKGSSQICALIFPNLPAG